MFNYVENKRAAKNVSLIVSKTNETTGAALKASVLCRWDDCSNFTGKLFFCFSA
jgi:hypothetical protein